MSFVSEFHAVVKRKTITHILFVSQIHAFVKYKTINPIVHSSVKLAFNHKQQIVFTDVPTIAKPVFIHAPKAENNLGVIKNKRLNSEGDELEPKRSKKKPILFDQAELNDLIRDINLSKAKAEFLESRLKEKNLLNDNVRIS